MSVNTFKCAGLFKDMSSLPITISFTSNPLALWFIFFEQEIHIHIKHCPTMADFPVSNSIVSIVSFEKPAGVTDGDTVAHINKINKEIDVNGHITSGSICQKKTTSKFPVHQNSSSVSFNKDDFISGTVVGVAIRSTSVQIGDDYSSNAGKSSPKINPNSRSSLNEKMIEANTFAEVPEPPKRRASFWKDIGIDDKSNKEILSLADNDQAVNNIGLEQERPWAGQSPAINANQLNSQFQKDTSRSSMQSSSYIYTVLKTILERTLKQLRESSPVCFIVRQSEKPKVRIIAALILLLLVPVGGVLAIISLATHKILPYIWIYNLVIVLLVLLVIVSPILLEKLFFEVTNACIASNMIQGLATLTDVTQNSLYRKIPYGKSYRVIAWWTEAGFIGVVFWLCISANWTPIDSFVTNGKCITPIYPDIVNIPNDLGDYLQGDTEFAVIYNYALPLYDGVVGGKLNCFV